MIDTEPTERPDDPTTHPDAPTEPRVMVPATPPIQQKSASQKAQETAMNAYRLLRLILFAMLGFVLAIFVVRNWDDVNMDYVFGDVDLPLAVVMLLFTAIGIVMGALMYWFLSRRSH